MNWLQKIAIMVPMKDSLEHVARAVENFVPGNWQVIENRPNLKTTYKLQWYGTVTLLGEDVQDSGDLFSAKVFSYACQSELVMPDEYAFDDDLAQKWLEAHHEPVGGFDSETGHPLVYFHCMVGGYSPSRNWSNTYKNIVDCWATQHTLVKLGDTRKKNVPTIKTPFEVASWIDKIIESAYEDFGGGDDEGSGDDNPLYPEWPYSEDDIHEDQSVYAPVVRNPGYMG